MKCFLFILTILAIASPCFGGGFFSGDSQSISGNAATATAFAANPDDCAANTYATTIAASGNLTCAQVSLSAGISGFGSNVATALATPSSANLATAVTDETGSGALVFGTSPALVTPTYTVSEIIVPASGNLSAAQLSGTLLNNSGQANDNTQTLAAVVSGLSFDVVLGTTVAKYFRLDPGASDSIYLDGVSCTDGKYIGVASAALGNGVSCKSFQTGAGPDYDWYCVTVAGPWLCE